MEEREDLFSTDLQPLHGPGPPGSPYNPSHSASPALAEHSAAPAGSLEGPPALPLGLGLEVQGRWQVLETVAGTQGCTPRGWGC
jgi:hypothetical protein